MAKDQGCLDQQVAIDPLPKPLRTYHREDGDQQNEGETEDEILESEFAESAAAPPGSMLN